MSDLTTLAHAARRGSRDALEALIRDSYADVRRLCSILVDDDTADDLAQETFARVLPALRRYRGEAAARTWILSITRRVCADELRSRTRRRRRDRHLATIAASDSRAAPQPGSSLTVLQLLAHLEPDRRAAFALTQLFRLPYQDAATICQCQPGTIRSRVARARTELIELLAADPAASEASG